jgi:hypothetical protein
MKGEFPLHLDTDFIPDVLERRIVPGETVAAHLLQSGNNFVREVPADLLGKFADHGPLGEAAHTSHDEAPALRSGPGLSVAARSN